MSGMEWLKMLRIVLVGVVFLGSPLVAQAGEETTANILPVVKETTPVVPMETFPAVTPAEPEKISRKTFLLLPFSA